ncbi:MAG: hypothetical protein PGN09_08450 [Sphingomonas fennica]
MRFDRWLLAGLLLAGATPAMADLRDDLTQTAFVTTDKAQAIAQLQQAIRTADGLLAGKPGDREATMQRAVAIGYRAKLTRSRSDAVAVKKIFDQLAASNPRDPEAQMLLATWNLDAVDQLGGFLAKTALGARREAGEAALANAVALSGGRPFFTGLAALLRIRLDPANVAAARTLAEAAAKAPAATPLDRLMKRDAALILPILQRGDGKAAAALAEKMLPFGRLG